MSKTWYSGSYCLPITFRDGDETSAYHQGACDEDVAFLTRLPYMAEQYEAIDKEKMRLELKGYGAWDDAELSDDADNFARLAWLAAADIHDDPESCEDDEPEPEEQPDRQTTFPTRQDFDCYRTGFGSFSG